MGRSQEVDGKLSGVACRVLDLENPKKPPKSATIHDPRIAKDSKDGFFIRDRKRYDITKVIYYISEDSIPMRYAEQRIPLEEYYRRGRPDTVKFRVSVSVKIV